MTTSVLRQIWVRLVGASLTVLTASTAFADPFTITGGTAAGDDSGAAMVLAGSNFRLTLRGESTGEISNLGSMFCPFPCEPAAVTFTGTLSGFLGTGNADINGSTYADVRYSGSLEFLGGETVVTFTDEGAGTVSGPFNFAAQLTGSRGGVALFSHAFVGQGLGTLRFLQGNANQGVVLDFTETAVTPEPASLLLMATGLAGVVRLRKRANFMGRH